jgi:hypothetical protein
MGSMESSQNASFMDSFTAWWQSMVQSLLALIFTKNSVVFESTGRTVYYAGTDARVGEGAYSVVLKASGAFDGGVEYALKKMLIQSDETNAMVVNEIQAFHKFRHPHIIHLLDSTIVDEGGMRVAYLLFPLARGSLTSIPREHHARQLPRVLQGFLAVCEAANVLHTFNPSYVHQDIKLEVQLSWLWCFATTDNNGHALLTIVTSINRTCLSARMVSRT